MVEINPGHSGLNPLDVIRDHRQIRGDIVRNLYDAEGGGKVLA